VIVLALVVLGSHRLLLVVARDYCDYEEKAIFDLYGVTGVHSKEVPVTVQ
jgi:hypothetical protein